MNDVIEKARELGMLIAESDEMKALKGAEELQLADKDAQELMMEYATTRERLTQKASRPDITKEEFESISKEMEEAFARIMTNDNIRRYIEANRSFKALIDQVNSIIAYFVKGEEQQGSCSGNCSSCGGCQ
jgi:cell fate (sporulation/competence/biofilm development) regulator YlbF (YheA/YmcA/DUF963 family)